MEKHYSVVQNIVTNILCQALVVSISGKLITLLCNKLCGIKLLHIVLCDVQNDPQPHSQTGFMNYMSFTLKDYWGGVQRHGHRDGLT